MKHAYAFISMDTDSLWHILLGAIIAPSTPWSGHTTLVSRRADGSVSRVDGWAVIQLGVRQCRTPVIHQQVSGDHEFEQNHSWFYLFSPLA